jgi:hypothetical protein
VDPQPGIWHLEVTQHITAQAGREAYQEKAKVCAKLGASTLQLKPYGLVAHAALMGCVRTSLWWVWCTLHRRINRLVATQ